MPWNEYQEEIDPVLPDDTRPGRVVSSHGGIHRIVTATGRQSAGISGGLTYLAELGTGDLPVVGDYVAVRGDDTPLIEAVLPRRTVYRRKEAGDRYEPQVICANCDAVAVVTTMPAAAAASDERSVVSALADYNPRRVERYLATLEGGVTPIVVLNKADLVGDAQEALQAVAAELQGATVVALSALDGTGVQEIAELLRPGETLVVTGSSGTGKSTLVGRLTGDHLRTTDVRETDGRGRHTTTDRRMYRLPHGGLLVDTPGMRELALWADADGVGDPVAGAFPEIAELAEQCKFRDCRHQSEPHCAVLAAVQDGTITQKRYESYLQLRDESEVTAAERRRRAAIRGKQIAKFSRALKKQRH